jgi:hypothetical protein
MPKTDEYETWCDEARKLINDYVGDNHDLGVLMSDGMSWDRLFHQGLSPQEALKVGIENLPKAKEWQKGMKSDLNDDWWIPRMRALIKAWSKIGPMDEVEGEALHALEREREEYKTEIDHLIEDIASRYRSEEARSREKVT